MAKAKNWIKAGDKHPGLFHEKAERAGKTTREYAEQEKDASGKLGKEARFAMNAMNAGKKSRRSTLYTNKKGDAEN